MTGLQWADRRATPTGPILTATQRGLTPVLQALERLVDIATSGGASQAGPPSTCHVTGKCPTWAALPDSTPDSGWVLLGHTEPPRLQCRS